MSTTPKYIPNDPVEEASLSVGAKRMLARIRTTYPEATVINIHQAFIPEKGWFDLEPSQKPSNGANPVQRWLAYHLKQQHVYHIYHVQLELQDRYGNTVYPDYHLAHLVDEND